jgi:hypothetical protein
MELSWELTCPKERKAMKFCYTDFKEELENVSSTHHMFFLVPMLANEFNVFSSFFNMFKVFEQYVPQSSSIVCCSKV